MAVCAVHANCYTLLHGWPSVVYRTTAVIDPIARYSARIAIFASPPAFDASVKEYCHNVSRGKLECVATRKWKFFDDMFIRFDRIHERDRQTDTHRHTYTARRHRPHLCKNGYSCCYETLTQSLWDHAFNSSGGSTLQWGVGRGMLCMAPLVLLTFKVIVCAHSCSGSVTMFVASTCVKMFYSHFNYVFATARRKYNVLNLPVRTSVTILWRR